MLDQIIAVLFCVTGRFNAANSNKLQCSGKAKSKQNCQPRSDFGKSLYPRFDVVVNIQF